MFDSFCCQVDKKQWYQEVWAVQVYICYAVQGELIYNSDWQHHWDFMMHPPGKFSFSDKGRFKKKMNFPSRVGDIFNKDILRLKMT